MIRRRIVGVCSALALIGCSADEGSAPTSRSVGSVVIGANFGREFGNGVAEGLDVDGTVSVDGDPDHCGKADFTSPDGRPGVDNQFATLLPLIEGIVGQENITQLLGAAIANGQLLIVLRLDGVDDLTNDDDVTVRLGAGLGAPYLDADRKYEPYQTFGFDAASAPVSVFEGGRIVDGVLTAGPADAVLPVRVLDANFNLAVKGSFLRFQVKPEPIYGGAALDGVLGGAIGVKDFEGIVSGLNIDPALIQTVPTIVGGAADIAPDEAGRCTRISATLTVQTETGFVVD
jgi:hypothetical protein